MFMPTSHVGACRLPEQVKELPHIHVPATHTSPSVSHIISSQGFLVGVVVANFVVVSGALVIVVAAIVLKLLSNERYQWFALRCLIAVILFLHDNNLLLYSLPFLQKIQSLPDKAVGSDSLFK